MELSSPLHLHKCLSGALHGHFSSLPSCTGECRFVRVVFVLIFLGGRTCVGFVLAKSRSRWRSLGARPGYQSASLVTSICSTSSTATRATLLARRMNADIVKIPGQQCVANRVNHGRLPAVVFPYRGGDTWLKSEHKGLLSCSKLPEVTD